MVRMKGGISPNFLLMDGLDSPRRLHPYLKRHYTTLAKNIHIIFNINKNNGETSCKDQVIDGRVDSFGSRGELQTEGG